MQENSYKIGSYDEYINRSNIRRLKQRKIPDLNYEFSNYILCTSNTNLFVNSGNNFYHRIFSPIVENLTNNYKIFLIGDKNYENSFDMKWKFLSKSKILSEFKIDRDNGLSKQLSNQTFKSVEKLPKYLNKARICWNAEMVYWSEKVWHKTIRGKLPKLILLTSYLCPLNLGLIRIAKRYNIKVIEIAHGKQGLYNPAYSHWGKNSTNEYNLLPNIFITWRRDSQKNFKETLRRESIYSCNPLLIKYTKSKYQKKYISIFLQGSGNNVKIPVHIKEFIKKNKDFVFAIKPHPGEEKPQYVNDLLKGNNVFLLNPKEDSYQLLLQSYCALTSYSSIIQDCVDLNINCGVYGKQGLEVYKEEIENDLVFDFTESVSFEEVFKTKPSEVSQLTCDSIKNRFKKMISFINTLATT